MRRTDLQHDTSRADIGSHRWNVLQVRLLAESSDGARLRSRRSTGAVLHPTRYSHLRLRVDDGKTAHQSPPDSLRVAPSVSGGASTITVRNGAARDRNRMLKKTRRQEYIQDDVNGHCLLLPLLGVQPGAVLALQLRAYGRLSELHFTVYVAFANRCVNPFIYTFQYGTFRQGLSELCCRNSVTPLGTTIDETDASRVAQQRS